MPTDARKLSILEEVLPTPGARRSFSQRLDRDSAFKAFHDRAIVMLGLSPDSALFLMDRGQRCLLRECSRIQDTITDIRDLLGDLSLGTPDPPDLSELAVLSVLSAPDKGSPVFRAVQEKTEALRLDLRFKLDVAGRGQRADEAGARDTLFAAVTTLETQVALAREIATALAGGVADFATADFATKARTLLHAELVSTVSSVDEDLETGDYDAAFFRVTSHQALMDRLDEANTPETARTPSSVTATPLAPTVPAFVDTALLPVVPAGSVKYKLDGGSLVTVDVDPYTGWRSRLIGSAKAAGYPKIASQQYLYVRLYGTDSAEAAHDDHYKFDIAAADGAPLNTLTPTEIKTAINNAAVDVEADLFGNQLVLLAKTAIADERLKIEVRPFVSTDGGAPVADDAAGVDGSESDSAHVMLGFVAGRVGQGSRVDANELAAHLGMKVQRKVLYSGAGTLQDTSLSDDDGAAHATAGDVLETSIGRLRVDSVDGVDLVVTMINSNTLQPPLGDTLSSRRIRYTVVQERVRIESSSTAITSTVEITETNAGLGLTAGTTNATTKRFEVPGVVGLSVGDTLLGAEVADVMGVEATLDTAQAAKAQSVSVSLPEASAVSSAATEWASFLDGSDDLSALRSHGAMPSSSERDVWRTALTTLETAALAPSTRLSDRPDPASVRSILSETDDLGLDKARREITWGRFAVFASMSVHDASFVGSLDGQLRDVVESLDEDHEPSLVTET